MFISAVGRICKLSLVSLLLFLLVWPSPAAVVAANTRVDDKMEPEELVAKHLESIGTPEARAAVRTRAVVGVCAATFRVKGISQAQGRVVMASEGMKNLVAMAFDTNEYPAEKIGFDGKSVTANYQRPGQYSVLGDFLTGNKVVSKEGLLGGSLSSAWPLLDLKAKNPHLRYAGTTKSNDRRLHKLEYLPRGGSDLRITLLFDSENFRHVRTDYQMQITGQLGNDPTQSHRQTQSRYSMVEEFSDFKQEQGLTLPHTYKLQLTISKQGATFDAEWVSNLSQFIFNGAIETKEFNVAG
jgi:hypothetical protein